ncbi:MAG: hypothetical protein Q8M99_03375 [Methylotenera sp.]|nr:hypothetical protein [Methylotenera sp.]
MDELKRLAKENIGDLLVATISENDPKFLERAAVYLYLKETHRSFEIEKERPSHERATRFSQLLSLAKKSTTITEEALVNIQNQS